MQSVGQSAPGSGVSYELEQCWEASLQAGVGVKGLASLQAGVGVKGLGEELRVEEGLQRKEGRGRGERERGREGGGKGCVIR